MEKAELVYPELSYELIGISFKVFNDAGFGLSEKNYQKIFAQELKEAGLPHEREKLVHLVYKNKPVGKYFLDFIVDEKIIVELKVRPRFGYVHINQAVTYLKATRCKLALIIYFTRDGVKYRRIVNLR